TRFTSTRATSTCAISISTVGLVSSWKEFFLTTSLSVTNTRTSCAWLCSSRYGCKSFPASSTASLRTRFAKALKLSKAPIIIFGGQRFSTSRTLPRLNRLENVHAERHRGFDPPPFRILDLQQLM